MRVAIVAEYYPRAADPVLGVWAHRQALAARDAGADVRVLVLHRPLPSKAALRSRSPAALVEPLRQPLRAELDGIEVRYVPFAAPARPRSYGNWGRWAAPSLRFALRRLRREFPFDLVHAHYAAPAGRRRPARGPRRAERDLRARRRRPVGGPPPRRRPGRALCAGRRPAGAGQLGRDRRPHPRAGRARRPRRAPGHRRADRDGARRGAGDRRAPRGPQAPRRRPACAVAAPRRAPGPALDRRRRRARSATSWSAAPTGSASATAWTSPARSRPPRRRPPRAAAGCSCSPAWTRRSASPTSRRWRAASPRSAAAASRGPRRSPRPAAACSSSLRATPRRSPPNCAALLADAAGRRDAGRGRARHRRGRVHLAALRRGHRGGLRGGAGVKPVLFVTNHAPPFRVGAFAALHEREDVPVRADRRRGPPRGRRRQGRAAVPGRAPARARRAPARRLRALSGRRGRPLGPHRAARRLPRRPRRTRPVRAVGDDLGPPADAGARALLSPAAAHVPPRGRRRHLRAARLGLRPRQGRRARLRGAAERGRRVLGRAGRTRSGARRSRPCSRAARRRRRAWTCCTRPGSGPRCPAPGWSRRATRRRSGCATSTRAATLWWCRPSPRATSWSRGASSSTKPSTRGSQSSPPTPSGPPRAASSSTSAPASSSPRATRARWPPPWCACTATRSCAAGSASGPGRRSGRTRTRPGRRAWGRPCRAAGTPGKPC